MSKTSSVNYPQKISTTYSITKILDLLDITQLKGEDDTKERNIVHNKQMTDINITLDKQYENWKESIPGKKYHYRDYLF